MKILGISLGTRDCGIAVLCQRQLIHWQMHNHPGKWSEDKLHEILKRIDRYIILHRIDQVVVKIPPATHHTNAFMALLKKLTELVQERGCLVVCTTKAEVKGLALEVINTETLMEYVTRLYPILLPEQAQELQSKRPYHTKMFEAVLAAHVFRKNLE